MHGAYARVPPSPALARSRAGNPCYTLCSVPVVNGVGNADQFASALKYAVDAYGKRTQIPETRMPIFAKVEDNIFDIGKAKGLQELKMARK